MRVYMQQPAAGVVQRSAAEPAKQPKGQRAETRKPASGSGGAFSVHHLGGIQIHPEMASQRGGSPLPKRARAKMENAFGADFSQVRIHEGARVSEMGAHAYTAGHHIHFAPGRYQPASSSGDRLLGHELTHVVQQRRGQVRPSFRLNGVAVNADPGLENKAERGGQAASAEESAQSSLATQTHAEISAPVVQGVWPWLLGAGLGAAGLYGAWNYGPGLVRGAVGYGSSLWRRWRGGGQDQPAASSVDSGSSAPVASSTPVVGVSGLSSASSSSPESDALIPPLVPSSLSPAPRLTPTPTPTPTPASSGLTPLPQEQQMHFPTFEELQRMHEGPRNRHKGEEKKAERDAPVSLTREEEAEVRRIAIANSDRLSGHGRAAHGGYASSSSSATLERDRERSRENAVATALAQALARKRRGEPAVSGT